ncbi:MAG: ATPase [Candidatus Accumulibacter sp.]|jgi:shikimate kinase|nr:ATPase [Accumulibacter sp.]
MKFNLASFRAWPRKKITLLGMSGVGKTWLSSVLRRHDWFHYSADYRIGKRYLDEPILDIVKREAMTVPLLRELLRRDWIDISNNVKVDDLGPVLSFVGKLGAPERGGLEFEEFSARQAQYREAEIAAMRDVPAFIQKAQSVYGYSHFVNDVGGSLCELEAPEVINLLVEHTLILYIQVTTREEEEALIRRAQSDPKPLYYRPAFLTEYLPRYLREKGLTDSSQADPDDFTRWIFPHLFRTRIPRYEAIARPHGYTVTSDEVNRIRDENDFIELLETAIGGA